LWSSCRRPDGWEQVSGHLISRFLEDHGAQVVESLNVIEENVTFSLPEALR